MAKTYLVQTWNAEGARDNHYEVSIEHEKDLVPLKKFLRERSAHVLITRQPDAPKPRARGAR